MDNENTSEGLEKYKQQKINTSVISRIQALLHRFDEDDRTDRRLALVGVVAIAILLMIAAYLW